jgi:RecA-family ATPase
METSIEETQITPLERVLTGLSHVRKSFSGTGWTARCPAHNDQSPSLSISTGNEEQVLLHCHAGCTVEAVVEALGLTMTDLFPLSSRRQRQQSSHKGVTLLDFALDKHLHWRFLINQGIVEEPKGGLRIPYYLEDGTLAARHRIRHALKAKEGSWWTPGPGDIVPYGLECLQAAQERGYLFLVEGETDVLTLRLHRYPALGIPGAEMVKTTLKASYLEGIEQLYIFREPDAAGQHFVEEVVTFIKKCSWSGKAAIVSLPDVKDPNDLYKRDPKGFPATFQSALDQATPGYDGSPSKETSAQKELSMASSLTETFSLKRLLEAPFSAPHWSIQDLLPEGLLLLAGKPKQGKSWLALQMALAVASGDPLFGSYQTIQGDVLYLALEDTVQRLQARSKQMLSTVTAMPQGLEFAIQWPRLDQGGGDQLETYLQSHPHVRLVIIDTWARMAPLTPSRGRSQYEVDYAILAPLKQVADTYHLSVLVVHHLRKAAGHNVLDEVNGSTGLVGAVDGILVLKRILDQEETTLFVTGRDLPEQSLSLTFNPTKARWVRNESERSIS